MSYQSQSRLNRLASVGYDSSGLADVPSNVWMHINRQTKEGQTIMDVSGIGSVSGATPNRPVAPSASQTVTAPAVSVPQDNLEISTAGKMLDRLSETPDVRAERLAQIKEAIENGAYDTDEKLEAALLRMFDAHGIDFDHE